MIFFNKIKLRERIPGEQIEQQKISHTPTISSLVLRKGICGLLKKR